MLDRYGRVINYLRISVTDRCNLRCCYCMPEGVQDVGMKNILTFEEIWEIVRTGVSLGITHIRITGGEPLVRKGCVDLIRGIREIPGVETITMTTNGVLLGNYGKQLKEAGVDYDMFGLSFYPFWDGTNENMQNAAKLIEDKYGKEVYIAETSYCYTSED